MLSRLLLPNSNTVYTNKTNINNDESTLADVENISVRLDQYEHDSFEQIMDRRRNQEQSSACGMDAVQSMLAVCCSSGPVGNGHRRVQADGCDSLPPTCSLECSSQFISIFENCQGQPVLEQLPPGQLGSVEKISRAVSGGAAVSRRALSCGRPACHDLSLSRARRRGSVSGGYVWAGHLSDGSPQPTAADCQPALTYSGIRWRCGTGSRVSAGVYSGEPDYMRPAM